MKSKRTIRVKPIEFISDMYFDRKLLRIYAKKTMFKSLKCDKRKTKRVFRKVLKSTKPCVFKFNGLKDDN